MEATLHALGLLLLKSCPTIILLVLLYIYLRLVFFQPIDQVLKQRAGMTEGARAAAQKRIDLAEQRAAEYEAKLRQARADVLREQEEARKQWLADQTAQLQQAKAKADELIARNREEIHEEAEKAQWDLAKDAETLAEQIAQSILRRRVN
jgi:F-type H+-transporting ATPase subunit b